jgi:tRNA(fMet)-specific endonuclease VapC
MAYLIDTDIIINSIKGNKTVNQKISEFASIPKAISIVTYGELLYGAKKSTQREKNTSIVYRLAEIFPIISITRATMEAFTDLKAALDRKGETVA